jgi:hypothetical protein
MVHPPGSAGQPSRDGRRSAFQNGHWLKSNSAPHEVSLIVKHLADVPVRRGRFLDELMEQVLGVHDATHGLLSGTVLRKPFSAVMEKMGLKRKLTARAMRRTYQDLVDEVQMRAAAAMAVSGHKTMAMKLHYSTAHDDEVRAGVGKVIQLATARKKAAGEERS